MSKKADLSWSVDGLVHSFNYYRYEAPTAIENLPAPLVSDISSNNYTDTTVEDDKQYYWRIGAVRDGNEKISNESSFTTMEWLKWWILNNSSVGDAWFARDVNQSTWEIPSLAGREARMISLAAAPSLVGKYLQCIGARYKIDNTDKSKWKFLHERTKGKFICFAFQIDNSDAILNPLLSTGQISSTINTAFALSSDNRSANNYILFQCSQASSSGSYTSNYPTAEQTSIRGSNIILTVTQNAASEVRFLRNNDQLSVIGGRQEEVANSTPASVLHLLTEPSGSFSFKGRFYGALVVDAVPNEQDRLKILEYFQDLIV